MPSLSHLCIVVREISWWLGMHLQNWLLNYCQIVMDHWAEKAVWNNGKEHSFEVMSTVAVPTLPFTTFFISITHFKPPYFFAWTTTVAFKSIFLLPHCSPFMIHYLQRHSCFLKLKPGCIHIIPRLKPLWWLPVILWMIKFKVLPMVLYRLPPTELSDFIS